MPLMFSVFFSDFAECSTLSEIITEKGQPACHTMLVSDSKLKSSLNQNLIVGENSNPVFVKKSVKQCECTNNYNATLKNYSINKFSVQTQYLDIPASLTSNYEQGELFQLSLIQSQTKPLERQVSLFSKILI